MDMIDNSGYFLEGELDRKETGKLFTLLCPLNNAFYVL